MKWPCLPHCQHSKGFHFLNIKPSYKLKTKQGPAVLLRASTAPDQQPGLDQGQNTVNLPSQILASAHHLHRGQIPGAVWEILLENPHETPAGENAD